MEDQSSSSSSLPIDQLPDDVLESIFANFTPTEICRQLAYVCRRWHRIAYSKSLWYELQFSIAEDAHRRNDRFALLLSKMSTTIRSLHISLNGHCRPALSLETIAHLFATRLIAVTSLCISDDQGLVFTYLLQCIYRIQSGLTPTMLEVLIDRMPNVRSLDIRRLDTSIDDHMQMLARVSVWPRLQQLRFPNRYHLTSRANQTSFRAVFRSQKRFTFLAIDLPLSERSIRTLVDHQHRSIIYLDLSCIHIYDASVLALTACAQLTFLAISCFTDISIGYLKMMDRLRHLHLYCGSELTESGFVNLFDAIDGARQLQYFRVHGSSINDHCIDAITKCCPNMIAIGIHGCSITLTGIAMIIDRLKHCRFFGSTSVRDNNRLSADRLINSTFFNTIELIDFKWCDLIDESTAIALIDQKRNLLIVKDGRIIRRQCAPLSIEVDDSYATRLDNIRKRVYGGCCMCGSVSEIGIDWNLSALNRLIL